MRFGASFLIFVLWFSMSFPISAQVGKPFEKEGVIPFAAIADNDQMIDRQCGAEGLTNNALKKAQNRAKNNFWATNDPILVDFGFFRKIQDETDQKIAAGIIKTKILVEHSKKNVYPADRNTLSVEINNRNFSEGTIVTIEAFVLGSHYSNIGEGESVNCTQSFTTWNDIHIVLGEKKNSVPCETITAEISPHFRPATWSRFHDRLNKTVDKKIKGLPIIGNKVRITGPLFYDASHKGCKNGAAQENPVRMSIWEIHPAYQIEIFNTATKKWNELDDWAKTH